MDTKPLLVCPKCKHSFPLVKFVYKGANNNTPNIHIKCDQCFDQRYSFPEYIELINKCEPLLPYNKTCFDCLIELKSNKDSYHCIQCSQILCKNCSYHHITHQPINLLVYSQKIENESLTFETINSSFLFAKEKSYNSYQELVNQVNEIISSLENVKEKLKSYHDKEIDYLTYYYKVFELLYNSVAVSNQNYNLIQSLKRISIISIDNKSNLLEDQISSIQVKINDLIRKSLNDNNDNDNNYSFPITLKNPNELALTINTGDKTVNDIIQLSNENIVSSNGLFISFWNKMNFQLIKTMKPGYSRVISFFEIKDTNLLAVSTIYSTIVMIDIITYQSVMILNYNYSVTWAFIQLSNGLFVSCGEDNSIILINNKFNGINRKLKGHQSTIRKIIELRNGNIASCSWDKTIHIWDITKNCLKKSLIENDHSIPFDLIELNENELISCGSNAMIKKWDVNQGKVIKHIIPHFCKIWRFCKLRDGYIASCSKDKTIAIINSETMQLISMIKINTNNCFKVIIQLNDGRFVTGDKKGQMQIWHY